MACGAPRTAHLLCALLLRFALLDPAHGNARNGKREIVSLPPLIASDPPTACHGGFHRETSRSQVSTVDGTLPDAKLVAVRSTDEDPAANAEACRVCVLGLRFGEYFVRREDLHDRGLLQTLFSSTCASLQTRLPQAMENVDCDADLHDAVITPTWEAMRNDEQHNSINSICASWGVPCTEAEDELVQRQGTREGDSRLT